MKKYFPIILPPSEARDATYDTRSKSKNLAFAFGVVIANALATVWNTHTWYGLLSTHATVGSVGFAVVIGSGLVTYQAYLLVCLRRSLRARQIVRCIDSGTACDPKVADALTIVGISLVTAVERYDAMVRRWKSYREGVELELIDRLSDEEAISDAIIAAGEELEAYATGIDLLFRRRALIKELSAATTDNPLPSFASALDSLRLADERLKNGFALREDLPAVDPERLLAEPLNLAKLDALDKDMAKIPVPARLTNG